MKKDSKLLSPNVVPGSHDLLPEEMRGKHLSMFAKAAFWGVLILLLFGIFYGSIVRLGEEERRAEEAEQAGESGENVRVEVVEEIEEFAKLNELGGYDAGRSPIIEEEVVEEEEEEGDLFAGEAFFTEEEKELRTSITNILIERMLERERNLFAGQFAPARVDFAQLKLEGGNGEGVVENSGDGKEGSFGDDLAGLGGESGLDSLPYPDGTGGNLVADPNSQREKREFIAGGKDIDVIGPSKDSYSPYTIRVGTKIPGVLESGINSNLPGNVTAIVGSNVYDTATGKYLLIPQGSRLFGSFSSSVTYGQEGVQVVWYKIIYPDGSLLDIGTMVGSEPDGSSGFRDKVNNHYFRLFGQIFLLSSFQAAGGATSDAEGSSSAGDRRFEDIIATQVAGTGNKLVDKNLGVQPTLEVSPGYRFLIIVNKDIVLDRAYDI